MRKEMGEVIHTPCIYMYWRTRDRNSPVQDIYQEYVIVIARGQGFMAVNQPESEGEARGQGRFT